MTWLIARLKEPSTWSGIVALLTCFGVTMSPELKDAIVTAGAAGVGVILVVMKERKSETRPTKEYSREGSGGVVDTPGGG